MKTEQEAYQSYLHQLKQKKDYRKKHYYENLETEREKARIAMTELRNKDRDGYNKHMREYRASKSEILNQRRRDKHAETKNQLLNKLGGKCQHCGEINRDVLEVDHVHGGGGITRKVKGHGITYYRDLLENFDSLSLQLLCSNCHTLKTKGLI